MKLHATIGDSEVSVEVRRDGKRLFAKVDGRAYELEAQQAAAGVMLRTAAGKVFDCRVEGRPSSGKSVDVYVGARRYPVTLTDPKRLRGAAVAGGQADGVARIVAPMPGKVVRVLVEPGAQVKVGESVVVVEAMKMQNELKAPKAGIIVTLSATVGATVNGGDVLAVIE